MCVYCEGVYGWNTDRLISAVRIATVWQTVTRPEASLVMTIFFKTPRGAPNAGGPPPWYWHTGLTGIGIPVNPALRIPADWPPFFQIPLPVNFAHHQCIIVYITLRTQSGDMISRLFVMFT